MSKILAAITTYDSAAYVDLSLTMLKSFGIPVVVIDDGSGSVALQQVCDKHKALLVDRFRKRNTKSGYGDVASTVAAIRCAYAAGYDYVLKISRRWICLESPIPSLERLITETDGTTFSSYTASYNFGFRTEFMCLKTSAWLPVTTEIDTDLSRGNIRLVEAYIHKLARRVEPTTEKYKAYLNSIDRPEDRSGYAQWDWMGTDKQKVPEYILWHNSDKLSDYLEQVKKLGLNWSASAFKV